MVQGDFASFAGYYTSKPATKPAAVRHTGNAANTFSTEKRSVYNEVHNVAAVHHLVFFVPYQAKSGNLHSRY